MYRSYLRTMTVTFFILSILAAPITYIYSNGNGYKLLDEYDKALFSVGNLGYTKSDCAF